MVQLLLIEPVFPNVFPHFLQPKTREFFLERLIILQSDPVIFPAMAAKAYTIYQVA